MIVTPRASHCFRSLIWLSRNKSVQKSRFSRIVKNSREFSLLDLDLEAFWFHFSLLEKEWKHFDFTLHFSKKSESFLFSLFTSRTSKTHSRWSLLWGFSNVAWMWLESEDHLWLQSVHFSFPHHCCVFMFPHTSLLMAICTYSNWLHLLHLLIL